MKFIYLVQGEADRVQTYFHLAERQDCKAFFLSYDNPLDGCTYLPDSTWAEGRNSLLTQTDSEAYDYLIFLDDDVELRQGSWTDFEQALAKYQPAVGVPLVSKVKRSPIIKDGKAWEYQNFMINDEQCLAIHHSVVQDELLVPYVTKFDKLSWWAACEIQQMLIQTLYSRHAIQFNNIVVENLIHGRHDTTDATYKTQIRTWLAEQLAVPLTEVWYYWEDWPGIDSKFDLDLFLQNNYPQHHQFEQNFKRLIANTVLFDMSLKSRKVTDYQFSATLKAKLLTKGSHFLPLP